MMIVYTTPCSALQPYVLLAPEHKLNNPGGSLKAQIFRAAMK
jgi:hypothetical protein